MVQAQVWDVFLSAKSVLVDGISCLDKFSEVTVMSFFKSYKFHCLVAHIVLVIEFACCLKGCTTSNNLWVSLFLWAAMVLSVRIMYNRLLPVSLRKNLLSPLFDELNVEKFRARFSGKFGDLPLATEVIYECFLTNDVKKIIDICTSYINKKHSNKRIKSMFLYQLARVYYFMGNKEKMREYYYMLCNLYKDMARLQRVIPNISVITNAVAGFYESNLKHFELRVKISNRKLDPYDELIMNVDYGITYYMTQRYDQAEQYFKNAVSIAPNSFYGDVANKYLSAIQTGEPPVFEEIVANQGYELYDKKTSFLVSLHNPNFVLSIISYLMIATALVLLIIHVISLVPLIR